MPRYFFDLYNDIDAEDEDGVEFPDLDAAEAHAIAEARHLASMCVKEGRLTLSHRIEILDQHRRLLKLVRFGDAVEVQS